MRGDGFFENKNSPFFMYLRMEGKGKRREEKEEMKGCDCERICFFGMIFLLFCFYCFYCCCYFCCFCC